MGSASAWDSRSRGRGGRQRGHMATQTTDTNTHAESSPPPPPTTTTPSPTPPPILADEKKLVAGHFDLCEYSMDLELVQFYIAMGCKITKVHQVPLNRKNFSKPI